MSYVATAGPGSNPDGNDSSGIATDVWQETVTQGASGGAGSYVNNGWEIYSYPDATGGIVDERHTFTGGAVLPGQTVSMTFANSAIQAGQPVGFSLLGGSTPISFTFTGGDTSGHYRYADAGGTNQDTGLPFQYQTNFTVSFTFTGGDDLHGHGRGPELRRDVHRRRDVDRRVQPGRRQRQRRGVQQLGGQRRGVRAGAGHGRRRGGRRRRAGPATDAAVKGARQLA